MPDGIDPLSLPPSSPELKPTERLWPLRNEVVANRNFADLDVLGTRFRTLRAAPAMMGHVTCYYWWPSDTPLAVLN